MLAPYSFDTRRPRPPTGAEEIGPPAAEFAWCPTIDVRHPTIRRRAVGYIGQVRRSASDRTKNFGDTLRPRVPMAAASAACRGRRGKPDTPLRPGNGASTSPPQD